MPCASTRPRTADPAPSAMRMSWLRDELLVLAPTRKRQGRGDPDRVSREGPQITEVVVARTSFWYSEPDQVCHPSGASGLELALGFLGVRRNRPNELAPAGDGPGISTGGCHG